MTPRDVASLCEDGETIRDAAYRIAVLTEANKELIDALDLAMMVLGGIAYGVIPGGDSSAYAEQTRRSLKAALRRARGEA